MTQDPRWIFARPRGGLTDTLAQIDRLRCHALRFGRAIALDLSASGLRVPFDALFRPAPSFGVPLRVPDAALSAWLDRCTSVAPPELRHIVTRHDARYEGPPTANFVEARSGARLCVDLRRDHPEQVVVHGQCGGGPGALRALAHLRLQPAVADGLIRRVAALGPDFAAVHVRHTDYRSDYKGLLVALGKRLAGRRVLLCTDNAAVAAEARDLWAGRLELCQLSALPDTGGAPLHEGPVADPLENALDQLGDLLALAAARVFVAAPLAGSAGRGRQPRYSGYSTLALQLRLARPVLCGLLADAAPELRRAWPSPPVSRAARLAEVWPVSGAAGGVGHLRHVLSVWTATRRVLRSDPVSARSLSWVPGLRKG